MSKILVDISRGINNPVDYIVHKEKKYYDESYVDKLRSVIYQCEEVVCNNLERPFSDEYVDYLESILDLIEKTV